MANFQMQARTQYPVLFLSDPKSLGAVPSDTGQTFVTATDSCICFWVQSYVDGVSTVILADSECDRAGIKLFSGSIATPSSVVSLSDSDLFRYINIPLSGERASVDIWSDDDRYPGWVWIKLTEIRDA